VEPPIAFFLAVINAEGWAVHVSERETLFRRVYPISEPVLQIPEVMLETYTKDRAQLFREVRPVFDALSNACGLPQSLTFEERAKEFARDFAP